MLISELLMHFFCPRLKTSTLTMQLLGQYLSITGIFFNNGQEHKEMRMFALTSLPDLGVGKITLDEVIQTEAEMFVEHLEQISERDSVLSEIKFKTEQITSNMIHNIVFGYRSVTLFLKFMPWEILLRQYLWTKIKSQHLAIGQAVST